MTAPTQHETLPGYERTEADIVAEAMAMPLADKIECAVGLLRLWEQSALDRDPERGYWVADSFGKDSDCIVELARMAGVRHVAHHNLTTIDPPELIREGRKRRPETVIERPERPLLSMVCDAAKGPPTRLARWCCAEYKERGGLGGAKVLGVRVEESARRATLWHQVVPHRKGDAAGLIICPILYWTEADVWAFHDLRGLGSCSLYTRNGGDFTRLGCIGCPLAGPKQQRKEFDRWPRYERNWQRAVQQFCERWHGVPTMNGKRRWFEDMYDRGGWEAVWDWWISGEAQGDSEPCQMQAMLPGLTSENMDE